MLPLVPAVGFWLPIHPGGVAWFGGNSPAMWLLMGLFYGLMAVSKQSIRLGGLAIFTANMGLWVMWQRQGLDFFHHPQLWLIPIALAALVAEHLDRRRLSDAQRTALRYLAPEHDLRLVDHRVSRAASASRRGCRWCWSGYR